VAYDHKLTKDPDAELDYTRDWTTYLGADTIATSTWIVPTGITLGTGAKAPTNNTTSATVWLSGGTPHGAYLITNRITTAGGRTDDRTFLLTIAEE
jgi:hypothetical protein